MNRLGWAGPRARKRTSPRRVWIQAVARGTAVQKAGRDMNSFGAKLHNAVVENA